MRGLLGARGGLLTEVLILLGLSLGASAIWSVLRIVERLTRAVPLGPVSYTHLTLPTSDLV